MHCDTLKQDNDSTVRGDGGSRVGEVRAGTTSPMPEHKGFKLQAAVVSRGAVRSAASSYAAMRMVAGSRPVLVIA